MPYVKTALLITPGKGENIDHFTAIRMRVTGQGNLDMSINSMDDIRTQPLVPFAMATTTNIQPTRLCNFNEQRAYFHLSTNVMNDYFRINRIIVFVKEFATSYPG